MRRELELHPELQLDLDEIWEYIARDSLNAADKVIAEILTTIDQMADSPDRGHYRLDLSSRRLRFLRVYDYLIAYAARRDLIRVIALLHGRRDPMVIAALLSSRYQ